MCSNCAREALKKSSSGMGCKAREAQRPRHIMEIGKEVSTAQRSRPPAQAFNQRFLSRLTGQQTMVPSE